MKAFFLTGSIVFVVLILILTFQNLGARVQYFYFLFFDFTNPFLMVTGIALIGMVTGALLTGLILTLAKGDSSEEESGGNEW